MFMHKYTQLINWCRSPSVTTDKGYAAEMQILQLLGTTIVQIFTPEQTVIWI